MMTAERRAFEPPNPKPCAHCPWRLSNAGRENQHGFYTKSNLRRLWNGLRKGNRMTCHPTDPHMSGFAGYEVTAGREVTHECAGAAIMVQRELHHFQECAKAAEAESRDDGFARYKRLRGGAAMTRDGLIYAVQVLLFGHVPPPFGEGLATRQMGLNDPDVGYDPLPWEAVE